MIQIGPHRTIPARDLSYALARSSGPGGQNVNKVESKVTLLFDLEHTASLTLEEKGTVRAKLPGRINKEGVLRVTSQKHRTQAANRNAARERFAQLLEQALTPKKRRRETRVPRGVKKKRLEQKRRRSRLKRQRSSKLDRE